MKRGRIGGMKKTFGILAALLFGLSIVSAIPLVCRSAGEMIDLGDLDDDPNYSYTRANAINDAGQVVGWSNQVVGGESRAFIWENGVMTNIGTPNGPDSGLTYDHSNAVDINDAGVVLVETFPVPIGDGDFHAHTWTLASGFEDKGHYDGYNCSGSYPNAMNDFGHIAATSYRTQFITDFGSVSYEVGIIWDGTEWVEMDMGNFTAYTSYGNYRYALDNMTSPVEINNMDQVVGGYYVEDDMPNPHAYVYANGEVTDLGRGEAVSINENGWVLVRLHEQYSGFVGTYLVIPIDTNLDGKPDCWFKDEDGVPGNDLAEPVLGDWYSFFGMKVNDVGDVVGFGKYTSSGADRSVFWDGYTVTDIGTLEGATSSQPHDLNIVGEVVGTCWGFSHGGPERSFMWRPYEGTGAAIGSVSDKIDRLLEEKKIDEAAAKSLKAKLAVAQELYQKIQAESASSGDVIIQARKSGGTDPLVNLMTSMTIQISAYVTTEKMTREAGEEVTLAVNDVIASLTTPPRIYVVPAYYWEKGCGPTAGGMVIGFWDRFIENPVSSEDDCALVMGDASGGLPTDLLPYANSAQVNSMIEDLGYLMGTDETGQTFYYMIESGLEDYAQPILGESWAVNAETYRGTALTWEVLTHEIDSSHPMVFFVDHDADGAPDHFVTVVGYCEIDTAKLYGFYSTYSFEICWAFFDSNKKDSFYGVDAGVTFEISQTP